MACVDFFKKKTGCEGDSGEQRDNCLGKKSKYTSFVLATQGDKGKHKLGI